MASPRPRGGPHSGVAERPELRSLGLAPSADTQDQIAIGECQLRWSHQSARARERTLVTGELRRVAFIAMTTLAIAALRANEILVPVVAIELHVD